MGHSVIFRSTPTIPSLVGSLVVLALVLIVHSWNPTARSTIPTTPLLSVVLFICAIFLFVEPIPQPQSYHNFADKRGYLCSCGGNLFLPPNLVVTTTRHRPSRIRIPNFGDVASNAIILMGGVAGVLTILLVHNEEEDDEDWSLEVCLPLFFWSTIGISLGSTYYHWRPTDASLVWDRLPMSVAFMAIFAYMLEEYVAEGLGETMLPPLVVVGILSVGYWRMTDDLRLYAIVAILPICSMPLLMIFHSPRHFGVAEQWIGLALYAAAKVCEDKDYEIYHWTGQLVSGHSLKHILAGLAPLAIAHMVLIREKILVE